MIKPMIFSDRLPVTEFAFFGTSLLYPAWIGFRDASYLLTRTSQIRSLPARFAVWIVGTFGLIVVGYGFTT